jgi:hypothetical protein
MRETKKFRGFVLQISMRSCGGDDDVSSACLSQIMKKQGEREQSTTGLVDIGEETDVEITIFHALLSTVMGKSRKKDDDFKSLSLNIKKEVMAILITNKISKKFVP